MRTIFPMTVITRVPRYKRLWTNLVLYYFSRLSLPFVSALHFILFARWTYVKGQRSNPATSDFGVDYDCDFLLFATNYSGRFEPYIDAFEATQEIKNGIDFLWGSSEEFPGATPVGRFKRYIRYHEHPVHFYYTPYQGKTVRELENALKFRDAVHRLDSDIRAENCKFSEIRNRFLDEANHLASGPEPAWNSKMKLRQHWEADAKYRDSVTFFSTLLPISIKPTVLSKFLDQKQKLVGQKIPFLACPVLHTFRLQVLDPLDPAFGGLDRPCANRRYFLLLVVEVDGPIEDFLRWWWWRGSSTQECLIMQEIFEHCEIELPRDASELIELLIRYQLGDRRVCYKMAPGRTVGEIREAEYVSRKFLDFEKKHSGYKSYKEAETWKNWLNGLYGRPLNG